MVRLHCLTLGQTQRLRLTQTLKHKAQWKYMLMSVSMQNEHLHIILHNQFLIGSCIGLGVGQCEHTIITEFPYLISLTFNVLPDMCFRVLQ